MSDLKVKLIAVVGVSANQEKYGFKIFRDLLDQGFNIVGVNVNNGEVLGKKILRSLKEINQVPDLVITSRLTPASITAPVLASPSLCKISNSASRKGGAILFLTTFTLT